LGRNTVAVKVMVVDDEPAVRTALDRALRLEGYDVELAGNGSEALRRLTVSTPDAIVLDVLMPEVDGLELCRRIRKHKQSKYTYVIIITALIGKKDYLEGMEAGADDFVTKPFDPDELKARLRVAERILAFQEQVAAGEIAQENLGGG
jgi:two-component system response regulator MprA